MSQANAPDAPSYWRDALSERPPALELPTLRTRAADHPPRAAHAHHPLDASARGVVGDEPAAQVAACAVLLHRVTRQTDLVIGVLQPTGPMPLRLSIDGNATFAAIVAHVRAQMAAAREHTLPLAQIARAIGEPDACLFQVACRADTDGSGAAATTELVLGFDAHGCAFDYDAERFDDDTIARTAGHLATLLGGVAASPDTAVGLLPLLTDTERQQILYGWNDKAIDFPRDATLHGLFEQQVAAQPDAIACAFRDATLSYAELDARANRLAHHLRGLGVQLDQMVGISVERSLEMVVGLLAIAKAGGAYLPMDPAYPRERLTYMVDDSKVGVVLTQRHLADTMPATDARLVFVDDPATAADQPATPPDAGVRSTNLAYVIYTSGSTGAPKGVVLNHRGRVNNFLDFNRRFHVGPGDALIALASLSFDMCAYDVFGILAAGATIALPDPDKLQDPPHWAALMSARGVTVWHTAPAMLKMLVDHLEVHTDQVPQSLRLVLLGGDWIPVTLPDRLRALLPECRVISMGGATECSMDSTIYEIGAVDPAWHSIPYGEPMANQLAYVLDPVHLQPLPVGVPGELFLGGIGVGEGYFQRPELTAERFLTDPFAKAEGARMYRTGDLARWMPDGNLELLGRMDNQVKIRGYRIELGEIEARLRDHEAVREGVVVTKTDAAGEKRLVAYVVQDPDWRGPEGDADELSNEQVEQWQAVYDHAYSANVDGGDDPTFNIVSWDSSYTNQPIPEAEMRVWVEQTVERIRARAPDRVLEIGCGMGLLLFRIAPHCSHYMGTDFSTVALDYVHRHAQQRALEQVHLDRRWADNFEGIAEDSLDAVVLNSIVLDFPSMDYLMDVLRGSAKAVRPGGVIFVGDVRGLPMLTAYQSSVQLFQAADDATCDTLRARVQRLIRQEEELVIDPRFFAWLQTQLPEIGFVQIQLKRGDFHNELNKFRYDVTLHIGDVAKTSAATPVERRWDERTDVAALRAELEGDAPELLILRGVRNARVERDVRIVQALAAADCPPTAGALRAAIDANTPPALDPEAMWQLADELGYRCDVRFAAELDQGGFDVAFHRAGDAPADVLFADGAGLAVDPAATAADFANNPMMGKLARQLGPTLRRALGSQLPDYMVPAIYVPMEQLPLSPNGKVDRKALPEPDTSRPDMESPYAAPETPVQEVVAGVWTDVLGLDRVGIHDAFLDLGGHSLLAVQIQARLGEIFPFEIALPDIFESRTVAALSTLIEHRGREAGVDAGEICEMLAAIEALSDDEVQSRIGNDA